MVKLRYSYKLDLQSVTEHCTIAQLGGNMTQDADFEEKEYEVPLFVELANGSPYVWSPGQVLENKLAFDGAQFTGNPTFWKTVGQTHLPYGVLLNPLIPRRVRRRLLPSFRFNLMLQVKTPQYLKRRKNGYNGNCPYYRFAINGHQQKILAKLAIKVGKRAFVGYASPAFWKVTDLYNHIVHSDLIANSTFVEATAFLPVHNHWAYFIPGTTGQVCSEPKSVEQEPLFKIIERMAREDYDWRFRYQDLEPDFNTPKGALRELSDAVLDVCTEESDAGNPFAITVLKWIDKMDSYWEAETSTDIRDFSTIHQFCYVCGVLWFTIG